MTDHNQDSDCTVVDDTCTGCGVVHGLPCEACGGTGFHKDTCTETALYADERALAAKFPVGARVRIIGSDLTMYIGLTGTVVDYDFSDEAPLVGVEFDAPLEDAHAMDGSGLTKRDGFYDDELVLRDAPAADASESARLLDEKEAAYAAFMAAIDASNAAQNHVMHARDAYLAAAERADKMR
jgi:hypothetical protein